MGVGEPVNIKRFALFVPLDLSVRRLRSQAINGNDIDVCITPFEFEAELPDCGASVESEGWPGRRDARFERTVYRNKYQDTSTRPEDIGAWSIRSSYTLIEVHRSQGCGGR